MIIAEIGLNHLGDSKYADYYLKNIVKSKVDAVTFQIREKSFYETDKTSSLKLSEKYYIKAREYCYKNKINFGVALADETLIDFFESLNVDFYKILSKDIENFSLLSKIFNTKKKIFLSTGLSGITEIKNTIKKVKGSKKYITLIHTQLSHNLENVNLKSIPFLQEKIKFSVGYGHHTINPNVMYLALAFNPSDVFFYVKGTKTNQHPDEEHALLVNNLSERVKNLNELSKSLGKFKKSKMKILIQNMK